MSLIARIADDALLREAWHRVQRGGKTAGVDGMTIDAFRARADERLRDVRLALRSGHYRPSPVKRVEIPKPDGGWRNLGIPTVTDRVVQTAAALVLHQYVATTFSDRSFAYRPFLGARRAAFYLKTLLPSAGWVVTADIAKYFDNVDHGILSSQLMAAGVDETGVQFVLRALRAQVQERGRRFQPVKGLPQGSPIAPVLANLYLTGFDTALQAEGFAHVRYADDFVVLAADQAAAERALRFLGAYLMSRLRLEIKPAKTQLVPLEQGFTFVGFRFTRDQWTVPSTAVERFKASIQEIVDDRRASLADACRAHNDLVAGWRNYYSGTSGEMDAQLADLDQWREDRCRPLLDRHGDPAGVGLTWFERLLDYRSAPIEVGSYGAGTAVHDDGPDPIVDVDELHRGGEPDARRDARISSSEQAFRDAEIGSRQRPELHQGGWLRIPTYGAFISKSHALLVVKRKKQVIYECAFDELTGMTIETDGAVVATSVIQECVRRRLPVTFSRTSGTAIGRIAASRSRLDAAVVHAQVRSRLGRSGLPIAKALLSAKLANQRALLLYHSKYRQRPAAVRDTLIETAVCIGAIRGELESLPTLPMRAARKPLFLLEARAAAHYWSAFAQLVPQPMQFRKRMHRDAADIVNRSLNYGYAVLLNRVWNAVHHAGLEPALGLVHTGRRRTPGLVFDLMEPFRQPVVDRTVLGLIGRGVPLSVNRDNNLSMRTRKTLHAAVMRRLAAPLAGGGSLDVAIRTHARELRAAVQTGRPLAAFRMPW